LPPQSGHASCFGTCVTVSRGNAAGKGRRAGLRVELRPEWEDIKLAVMEWILWEKFSQNPGLGAQLMLTGDRELIEGNRWGDRWSGVDLKCTPPTGENWLGRLLMITRTKAELRVRIRRSTTAHSGSPFHGPNFRIATNQTEPCA
jgi:predicted NAD-dependent protein-ADP-ribosyltransferase YbiA (DUF1768 family)